MKNRPREESRWIFLRSDEKHGAPVDVFTRATHFRSSDLTGRRLQRPITRRRIAAAHKNVSLGCRNISAETYRGNGGRILDPRDATRSAILSSLSGHFCAFIVLLSGKTRDGSNTSGQLKRIAQRSMHCSRSSF